MSDHSLFSSYKEQRTGKIRGAFSGMHRALDGWMLARAPASPPAQGLHHHGPRYFIFFPYFCTMCGLEKLGLVHKKNWLERNLSALLLKTLAMGRRQHPSRSRLLSIWRKEVW